MISRFKKTVMAVINTLMLAIMVCSCRIECPIPDPDELNLKISIDRSLMNGCTQPLRLIFYPINSDPSAPPVAPLVRFASDQGCSTDIPPGRYNVLVINDETENISFRGLDSYETAEAYMDPLPTKSDHITVAQPEMLYVSDIPEFEITADPAKQLPLELAPRSVVATLNMKIAIDGMQSVSKSRGTLTGIAPSIYLHPSESSIVAPAAVKYDCEVTDEGVHTGINYFATPVTDTPVESQFGIKIDFLLVDGTVITNSFDITHHIEPEMGAIGGDIKLDDLDIVIPDVKPGGGGGLDPDIGDWGDPEDIPLQ